ncbi:heme peroxidase [Georgenia muralis]|uniref:heme peroxidase n=1 Tax=Georgenia muralis TaxID=154117 RepID=UPI000F50CB9B|nr:heme peroxidase [Georgenia muralis]
MQKVVARYRTHRGEERANGDDLDDIRNVFAELGGVEGWTRTVGNRHESSTAARAPLKAEVILRAATRLPQLGVTTTEDLRTAPEPKVHDFKAAWLALPGQKSGISWRYLLMLAGVPGVKPDRMVRRFVESSSVPVDPWMSAGEVAELVEEAARRLGVSASALDHAIWLHESGRKASKPLDRPDKVPAGLA